jgi:NAD(P)H-dependent flavin oxidoreductase YrpB (nitropropane dioxygenase family)
VISKAISGKTLRQIRTPYTEAWDKGSKPPLGWPFHSLLTMDVLIYAYEHKDQPEYDDMLVTPTSQATRLLNKRRTSKQIIDDMVEGAIQILEGDFPKRIQFE